MRERLIIGTRKSALALWQSGFVKGALESAFPGLVVELLHIVTTGDKTQESNVPMPAIGGKGLFTAELEDALIRNEIDLAVHSLKDLPTVLAPEFTVGAIPPRGPVADVLVSRSGQKLEELPAGAVIGTSSLRRSAQLLSIRPDLKTIHIRGNVDTRLRKLRADGGEFDAILLAEAGLQRLGLGREITQVLTDEQMLPAPGQGALGIECRAQDSELRAMLKRLHDDKTASEVAAERAFLRELNAGCNTPVAARAVFGASGRLVFHGRCLSQDATMVLEVRGEDTAAGAEELGIRMAQDVVARGFRRFCAA